MLIYKMTLFELNMFVDDISNFPSVIDKEISNNKWVKQNINMSILQLSL